MVAEGWHCPAGKTCRKGLRVFEGFLRVSTALQGFERLLQGAFVYSGFTGLERLGLHKMTTGDPQTRICGSDFSEASGFKVPEFGGNDSTPTYEGRYTTLGVSHQMAADPIADALQGPYNAASDSSGPGQTLVRRDGGIWH